MRCYQCGSVLTGSDTCPNCGAAVRSFKRIVEMSNYYCNLGLGMAKAHHLSGAEAMLIRSLKFHKRNVQARNLLGLVYYEQGRISDALSEWIVSSNILPQDNPATEYIREIQGDPSGLDTMNKQIRRYNEALTHLKGNNQDLAVIQLKKLIGENTKLIDVYLLMALLCMQGGNRKMAGQCVKKALQLDHGNVRAAIYRDEVRNMGKTQKNERKKKEDKNDPLSMQNTVISSANTVIMPQAAESKEMSTLYTALRFAAGFLCGAAVVGFLILPARVSQVRREANLSTTNISEDVSSLNAQVDQLSNDLTEAQASQAEAEATAESTRAAMESYDQLLTYWEEYQEDNYSSSEIALFLNGLDKSVLSTRGQTIYDTLYDDLYEVAQNRLYNSANESMEEADYATAIEDLEKLVQLNAAYADGDGLYTLAQAYVGAGRNDDAIAAYQRIIDELPGTEHVQEAEDAISALSVSSTGASSDSSTEETE